MQKILRLALILWAFPGFSQTFSGTGGMVSDDGANNDFSLTVTGLSPSTIDSAFGLTGVCINMTHTYDSDMEILLISPDGTQFRLLNAVGGSSDNFTNTCFSATASSSIAAGSAPFTGTFKPMERMGSVNNGQNGNGTWKLRCIDHYASDVGNLLGWNITFGAHAQGPLKLTSSNLPIVILDTYGGTIVDEPKITTGLTIIDNGYGTINNITDAPAYTGQIGIEIRGAYSSSLPQKPYGFETRDALGNQMDTMLLGMPSEHDWVLIAEYNDKAFVRNTLAYKLFNEMGNYSTRMRFCEVVLNGQYQGIYLLGESIKRDKNRVDISKLKPTDVTGLDVTGGYIIKNDYWDGSNSFLSDFHPIDHSSYDVHIVYDYPKPADLVTEQKDYIAAFVHDFEAALYSTGFSDTTTGYRAYADVFSFVDYFIINELSRNNDGFKKSSYFHKKKDKSTHIGKLYAGPVWDFDWAYKNIPGCSIFSATDGSGWAHHINDCTPDVNSTGWYVRMMQDTGFQNILRCRWERFRTGILDTTYLFNYIDTTTMDYLYDAQLRHYENWQTLGLDSGSPEVGPIPATYAGEVEALKEWLRKRISWLDDNIPGNAVNCEFTGVPQLEDELQIRVYPNPATQYIFVEAGGFDQNTTLRLINQAGELVLNKQVDGRQAQIIDVSGLSTGLYVLHLQNHKGQVLHRKVAITR